MSSPTSSPSGVRPPKRSHTGATGSSKAFTPPARAPSFAIFSRNKNKKKLKSASVSSYRLETDDKRTQLEEWLISRFGVSKAELNLELRRDFYIFKIPEQDNVTEDDERAVEDMRD